MKAKTITSLDELWEAALPPLTPDEQRAGIVLLRELARGEPVSAAQLARALGAPVSDAEALLRDSALSPFVYPGDGGPAEGFWGLATTAMRHRFTIDGHTLWTWCAEDSLFLPELLDVTADVESPDPESGQLVRLRVSPERVEAVQPADVLVSMVRPDTADFSSAPRIIATACHFIFFFTSPATGERWVAAHPDTMLLPLDEAFALGKRQNARLFGAELVRRSADTA